MPKKTRFLNCKIDLSKEVFQPRIETEFWVKKALQELTENSSPLTYVLDIFAGTGCVGIAVLKNIKNSQVDFVDISKEAIRQIKINLRLNKILKEKYRIFKSNLFEKLKGRKLAPYRTEGSGAGYDIVFANPPYVALDRISEVNKEVLRKEPAAALFAGKDGMYWIKKFLSEAKKHLKQNGKIFMEFDPQQKIEIEKILEKEKFKFEFKKDQFKKYRWLKAKVKGHEN